MPADLPLTLLDHLSQQFPAASRTTLKRMVSRRRVSVNDRPATRLSEPVGRQDHVVVLPRPPGPTSNPLKLLAPLRRVYEDDDVLIVDKPAGLLTSTVRTEKRPTALAAVRRYVSATSPRARIGLIHRLDRDASGLLVFSKSDLAYQSLKTQFFKHSVDRQYEAEVKGVPSPLRGRIDSRLIERADGTVHSTEQHARGQRAVTDYEVIARKGGNAILRVRLLTGRKHQIRVHLSERGHPIIGDHVYGERAGRDTPLRLRAVMLGFIHPRTGKRVSFVAERREPGDD